MDEVVYYRHSALPPPDRKEILRYAGAKGETRESAALLDECLKEAEKSISFGACYRFFSIEEKRDCLSLGFAETKSATARRALLAWRRDSRDS